MYRYSFIIKEWSNTILCGQSDHYPSRDDSQEVRRTRNECLPDVFQCFWHKSRPVVLDQAQKQSPVELAIKERAGEEVVSKLSSLDIKSGHAFEVEISQKM